MIPRVDSVVIRKGASPEEILLKVEGPKVIERGGGTWNVNPADYVVFLLKQWLREEGQKASVKRVNPSTVQVRVLEEKEMSGILEIIQSALVNSYVEVSGYGVTEPLTKPTGRLRKFFRGLKPFKFEDEEEDDSL